MPKSVLRAVLGRMQFTLHATRRTTHGASRLVQAMSAWLVKTRRAPSRHGRDARVYSLTTTAMHKLSTPPPPARARPPPRGGRPFKQYQQKCHPGSTYMLKSSAKVCDSTAHHGEQLFEEGHRALRHGRLINASITRLSVAVSPPVAPTPPGEPPPTPRGATIAFFPSGLKAPVSFSLLCCRISALILSPSFREEGRSEPLPPPCKCAYPSAHVSPPFLSPRLTPAWVCRMYQIQPIVLCYHPSHRYHAPTSNHTL